MHSVGEQATGLELTVETNDAMMAVYMGALMRATLAIADLIENKLAGQAAMA